MGLKIIKKIAPITIGLTIIPKTKPKRIHNLFKGLKISALKSVTKKKTIEHEPRTKNAILIPLKRKYIEAIKKMNVKKYPNL